HVRVRVSDDAQPHRHLSDIRALLGPLPDGIRLCAQHAFELLAEAEAAVHRVPAEEVHFHEVGALDAIADIVGACAGVQWLRATRGLTRLTVSPVEAGSGATVRTAHGNIPVPVPAVVEIARLRGIALTGA